MELKDLAMDVADLSEVRGGANHASNESHNGGILNLVGVSTYNTNNSSFNISNGVLQNNTTTQTAGVSEVRDRKYSLTFDHSQLFAGFGGYLPKLGS